jgi:hypothetical protein
LLVNKKRTIIFLAIIFFDKLIAFIISQTFNDIWQSVVEKNCTDQDNLDFFEAHRIKFENNVLVLRQINFGIVFFLLLFYFIVYQYSKPTPKSTIILNLIKSPLELYFPVLPEDKIIEPKLVKEI